VDDVRADPDSKKRQTSLLPGQSDRTAFQGTAHPVEDSHRCELCERRDVTLLAGHMHLEIRWAEGRQPSEEPLDVPTDPPSVCGNARGIEEQAHQVILTHA
jgi:hypothetical protein